MAVLPYQQMGARLGPLSGPGQRRKARVCSDLFTFADIPGRPPRFAAALVGVDVRLHNVQN